ncbi:MAG: MoxR family ATPase [Nitrososphaerales archaeon]|nr:MoxR family ATPase [Nitrososphaerales archaeon]
MEIATIRPMPTFELLPKVMEAETQLFSVWLASERTTQELISLLPLAKDTKALLAGPPGAGKSVLIEGICRIYFGLENLGKVQADPSLTPDDVLYRLDLAKLIRGEGEVVYPREVVTKPVKWLNEVTRANSVLQDAFLGLLAEHEVSYRDAKFRSPPFVALADYNPADMGGSQELSWPVSDRFDVLIEVGALPLLKRVSLTLEKYQGKHHKDLRETFKSTLTFEEMQKAWEDVERVTVPEPVSVLAELLVEEITGCIYDRNRVSALYRESCAPGRCEFFKEMCSKIERPASYRVTDALVSLGKARAWRDRRPEISIDDILFLMPYVLAHRAKVKAVNLTPYNGSAAKFFREEVGEVYESKKDVWKEAVQLYSLILSGFDKDAMAKLRDIANRDLATRGLYSHVGEAVRGTLDEILRRAQSEAFTAKDVETADGYVGLLDDSEQKLYSDAVESLRKELQIRVTKDVYVEKLIPVVALFEPKLAAKVGVGEYRAKRLVVKIAPDTVSVQAEDSEVAKKLREAMGE